MRRNLATSLRCRGRSPAMARYDRLPPELRQWLAEAALPWSPGSVLRLWRKFVGEAGGNAETARRRLDLVEARMLMKDAPRIWGSAPPVTSASPSGRAPKHGLPDHRASVHIGEARHDAELSEGQGERMGGPA